MLKRTETRKSAHWEWSVPSSWAWVRISEVADVIGGGTPSTSRYEFWDDGKIPWITPADLTGYTKREISRGARFITQLGLDNSSARLLPARSVLLSSRAPVGYVAIAANPLATNQGFKSFVLSEQILPEYVYFYLRRAKDEISKLASGTTFIEISAKACASIPLPIPPAGEQVRIVAKLDALLPRVAAGETATRRALDRLQQYRAAVLHAAVTGELTRDWRKTHQPDENGVHLLKRLLRERRARWEEAELKLIHARGKSPKGDKWKHRYPEPALPDITGLHLLPKSWTWMSVSQGSIKHIKSGISVKGKNTPPGIASLKLNAMDDRGFDYSQVRYLPLSPKTVEDLWIQKGDFFVSRGNGTLHLVGRGTLARETARKVIFPDTMIRIRLAKAAPLRNWVAMIWPSILLRGQIESKAKTTAGIYKISQGDLARFAIPLPPLNEQMQLIREVESRLIAADRLAAALNQQLDRANGMRQSLLREAYVGKLVPQDAKDEPAHILLERIRAARDAEAKKPKAKRTPKMKAIFSRRPLLEILRKHMKPLTPEQLFREAGFQPKEVHLFYRELASLRKILREKKPSGAEARAWPHRARVMLQLKED